MNNSTNSRGGDNRGEQALRPVPVPLHLRAQVPLGSGTPPSPAQLPEVPGHVRSEVADTFGGRLDAGHLHQPAVPSRARQNLSLLLELQRDFRVTIQPTPTGRRYSNRCCGIGTSALTVTGSLFILTSEFEANSPAHILSAPRRLN